MAALLWLATGLGLVTTTLFAQASWQMKQAPLMTQWAGQIDTNNPLPEYPRPQLVRTNWSNLNGIWQFQAGATNDPVPTNQTLSGCILVPYPMESAISGVMQYNAWSWYRRTFTVPAGWSGKRIILHLDAVDWQSQVYINGQSMGMHKGGYDPVSYDITPYLNGGSNELIVQVYSPEDNGGEPRGKQTLYPGVTIMYTSSSGIWQPVWLEPVDSSGVQNLTIIPDLDNSRLRLTVNTYATSGVTVSAAVLDNGTAVAKMNGNPQTELDIPIANPKLWSPSSPFLYDLQIAVVHNGMTNDMVTSYFGMRKISTNLVKGRWRLFLNNQYLFELGPLDQGFWPDGLYTAPTDAALAYDIQMEKAFGYNMVRKHLKVERQRWYYWADKLGILVWQDMPSCNTYTSNANPPAVDPVQFTAELSAMVTNLLNSPSIIMWNIFNEGQGEADSGNGVGQTNTAYLVKLVETLDPSRLVNQASGWNWVGVGAVDDIHNYPDPGNPINNTLASVDGEFGSIGFVVPGHMWYTNYTYGGAITISSTNELVSYYDYYVNELVNCEPSAQGGLNGGVYTEITDMEDESSGLLTYDRLLKIDPAVISSVNKNVILAYNIITDSATNSELVTTNFSFEEDVTAPDTAFAEVPTGWSAFNEASQGDIGSENAGGTDFTVINPLAAPADGNQYCYINLYKNPNSSTGIYQDVGALQANTTYTLTVAVGSRIDIQTLPGIISLLNGADNTGTVLASTNGAPATQNTWQDYTVGFTTGASVSGDLTIELWVDPALSGRVASGINNIQGDFDNVRLTVAPIIFNPPILGPANVSGGNLILTGTGGTANAGYTWLTTTNLSAPISWTTNSTGTLDGTGSFSNAIPIEASQPACFLKLRMP